MVEEEDDEIFKKENPTVFKKYRVKKKNRRRSIW